MSTPRISRFLSAVALTITALAGVAHAQSPFEAYASGLLHQHVGNALLGPVDGRRLPVRNLGSSGEDGVEIQLHSVAGGGVAIDTGGFLAAGGEIKIKHKGWDGLIYHRTSSRSNGNGTGVDTFDFSPLGVTSLEIVDYDANGIPISTQTVPGPIADVPWVGQVIPCPSPCFWTRYYFWATWNGKPHLFWRGVCVCPGNGDPTGGGNGFQNARVVTPNFPPGIEAPPAESLQVLGSGFPEFTVTASELGSFGVRSNGIGQAHISEECQSPTGDCAPDERRLPVRNLGSSGQDGVEIKWPKASRASFQCDGPIPDGSGTPATMVTRHDWIKASWDHPRDLRCTQTAGGSTGSTSLSFDTSAFGGVPIRVTTSVGGMPTGGGTGNPLGYLINTNTLDWILAHPLWAFNHGLSLRISNLNSPTTGGPITVFLLNNGTFSAVPADTIDIEVLATETDADCSGLTITAAGTAGNEFSIGNVVTTPVPTFCPADVDDGSGTGTPDGGVTIDDLLYYLFIFEAGDLAADVDDGSGTGTRDGGVTIDDLLYYLQRFEAGC